MSTSTRSLLIAALALGLASPAMAGQGRARPAGSTSSGSAVPRGSSGDNGAGAQPAQPSSAPAVSSDSAAADPQGARNRGGRPVVGTAMAGRPRVGGFPVPLFGRSFYPYSFGLGLNYGFYGYPYGVSPFFFGGYGPWYDPFWFDPFYFPTYGAPYGPYDQGDYRPAPRVPVHPTGSLRFKVSPDTADVYIDGAKVGTASEFDGLVSHHLVLESGTHQLELRADGYETYSAKVVVETGQTMTERVSLKKSK